MSAQDGAGPPPGLPGVGAIVQGRYRLLGLLGSGGMGTVYRAERLGLARPVAVKFLQTEAARDPRIVKRFEVEARAMSRLSHPNCVSILDFGFQGGPFLVMDLVEGTPLSEIVQQGALPPERAVTIARQVLAALAHAHAQGIVHRDIKPENVLVEKVLGLEDHVRVVDFGLAKLLRDGPALTVGVAVGTPNYMAPEQMREGPVDERVDVYGVGLLLYEMLTGKKPFDAPELGEIFRRQLHAPPPPFSQVAPGRPIPPRLEGIVRRALEKDPAKRYGSALELRDALAAKESDDAATIIAGPPSFDESVVQRVAASPASSPGTKRAPSWAVALIAAAAIGIVGWAALRGPSLASKPSEATTASKPRTPAPAAVPPSKARAVPAAAPPTVAQPPAPSAVAPDEIAELKRQRRENPKDPAIAARLAAALYQARRWSEGVATFRALINLSREHRSDATLIDGTISALGSERAESDAEELLGDLGAPARERLKEAARTHPSAKVRARARDILKYGARRPLFRFR